MARRATTAEGTSRISEIRTTVGDRAAADRIARRLVEDRLAACVQIDGGVDSVYRWNDAVETASEWRLTAKTAPDRSEDCVAAIVAHHAYEVPEVLVSDVAAARAYAEWVVRSTSP